MNKDVLSAKRETVAEIVNLAKASNAVIVAEYRGLTVAQIQELRRALRAENATMNVYTLLQRVTKTVLTA